MDISQPGFPKSDMILERPVFLDKMLELSKNLAVGIPHVRVDWYYTKSQLFFGEMTFFDGAGFIPFNSDNDLRLGKMIRLPKIKII